MQYNFLWHAMRMYKIISAFLVRPKLNHNKNFYDYGTCIFTLLHFSPTPACSVIIVKFESNAWPGGVILPLVAAHAR